MPNGGDYTGADDLFTVQFVSGGEIKYRINGVVQATTDHDWTPDNAQFFGEIITNGVTHPQMPGDSNHKVDFVKPAFFSNNDDLWHNLSPWGSNTSMQDTATYGNWQRCDTNDNPKFFKVWDTRYSTLP